MNTIRTLTVVAPLSLESWYHQFAGSEREAMFVGEDATDPMVLADQILSQFVPGHVRILSGHDSLLRDWLLAKELRARGVRVSAQSGMAAAAGVDKVLQKQLLALVGIPTPKWGWGDADPPQSDQALWKGRAATQSRGLVWHADGKAAPADTYWEDFIEGVEYSVVLYRDDEGTALFPTVWKGPVQKDLAPPWRRLRLVPAEAASESSREMADTALRIAELLDAWGYVEVEFILPAVGPAVVIDINPRICGTMRIVAMATGLPIFDPSAFRVPGTRVVPPVRFAAEVPYEGQPFTTQNAVASSRVTCASGSARETLRALSSWSVVAPESSWPLEWREN